MREGHHEGDGADHCRRSRAGVRAAGIRFPGDRRPLLQRRDRPPAGPRLAGRGAHARPRVQRYRADDKAGAVDAFFRGVFGSDYRGALEEGLPGAFEQAVAHADAFFSQELPALQQWSFTPEEAPRITQPVLAVLGENTAPTFPERRALLLSWLPNGESPPRSRRASSPAGRPGSSRSGRSQAAGRASPPAWSRRRPGSSRRSPTRAPAPPAAASSRANRGSSFPSAASGPRARSCPRVCPNRAPGSRFCG